MAGVQGHPHLASGEEEDRPQYPDEPWTQPHLLSVVLPSREVAKSIEPWLLVEAQGWFL